MDVTDPQAEDIEPPPVIAAAMDAEFSGGSDPAVIDDEDLESHDVPQEGPLMMPRRNGKAPKTDSAEHAGLY